MLFGGFSVTSLYSVSASWGESGVNWLDASPLSAERMWAVLSRIVSLGKTSLKGSPLRNARLDAPYRK